MLTQILNLRLLEEGASGIKHLNSPRLQTDCQQGALSEETRGAATVEAWH